MQNIVIIYMILALLLSFSIAYFQYYFREKNTHKITIILFFLRVFSVFMMLILLINLIIENEVYTNEKPILSLLIDNSKSIDFLKESKNVSDLLSEFNSNTKINNKFSQNQFQFGKGLDVLDSLTFQDNKTDIYNAISEVQKLNADKIAPIILVTDGNQTIGSDYEFLNSKQPIYPIVVGDTTQYSDVKITKLNVNKYSFLNNQFPVEVLMNYEGKEKVTTEFRITSEGKTIFRENISFSAQKNTVTISTKINSNSLGVNFYGASIQKIENEKNTKNNSKMFSVEVIDEEIKVLILTSILHPDLGVLKKAIESNKQRSATISLINDFKNQINDFQLIILYQVNNKFEQILNEINTKKIPFLFISGAKTDWNFVNNQQLGFKKIAINQTENYGVINNEAFMMFQQNNIGFDDFPPLKDFFGELIIDKEFQVLLFQNINGIQTSNPLLATFNNDNHKFATLFGEGIWKWRSASFLNNNSFEDFDAFIVNLVAYLASTKKRDRLEVSAESLFPSNSIINISAFYSDSNNKFDPRASLEIAIKNTTTNETIKFPFSLVNNAYHATFENLNSGKYEYQVAVLGENIFKNGRFVVTDYQIEEQFSRANFEKLMKLALNSGGKVFFVNQSNNLIDELLENESFYTVQKSIKKQQSLLDLKWILYFIIAFLSIEWFIRKYIGKI